MVSRILAFSLALLLVAGFALPVQAQTLAQTIVGVEGTLRDVLETGLTVPPGLVKNERINVRWLRRYQKQLPDKIRRLLEPYGYFEASGSSELKQDSADDYLLEVRVNPGQPLRITGLDLKLEEGPPELSGMFTSFPLKKGDILRQDSYDRGKADLKQRAADLGYIDARFTRHEIRVNLSERKADIFLTLALGPRYRFGETSFSGQDSYSRRFLQRYLSYRKGDYFSAPRISKSQINLINSDFFDMVKIEPDYQNTTAGQIPVQVSLDPQPRHQLRPGIGYGTDTGARVSLQYRSLNIFSLGHELHGSLLVAERRQSLLSTYVIPDMRRLDSQILLHLGATREATDTYLSREVFSEIEYQRALSNRTSGSVFLRHSSEYAKISDESDHSKLLLHGIRLTWRDVGSPMEVSKGLQLRTTVQGSYENPISDATLVQLITQITSLTPLSDHFSLLFRAKGGTTWQRDAFEDVPVSLRFYAGGDRTVRGYAYQSLGPKNSEGDVVGGKHLLTASVELERSLSENWGIAVFYDVGNAFNSFSDYDLAQGAGFGVRRYTKIGAFRLDLARQLNQERNHYRVHFSVGIGW